MQAEGRTALAVRKWRILFSVAWAVWILDLATKIWAVNNLSYKSNIKVIGEFLQLTFVRNPGAAFSFAAGATIFLSLFITTKLKSDKKMVAPAANEKAAPGFRTKVN